VKILPRQLIRLIGPLGLALALGACASSGHQAGKPFIATAGADGVQRVSLIGGSYYFEPSRIVVRANLPVELTLRKEGWLLPHEFILSAPEAGIEVAEGLSTEPRIVRFTPTRAGSFPFYCGKKFLFFSSHREQGMEGILEVLP
jgi:plastocyanin domain-containing protein